MTTFHIYAPTCGYCGDFLSPEEREFNLQMFSDVINLPALCGYKLLCIACYNDDLPDPIPR